MISSEPSVFTIIELNDKQYKVSANDTITVDRVGKGVINVLVFNDGEKLEVGTPYLSDFGVELELLEDKSDAKITVSRYKSKSRYRRKKGFRQPISILKVTSIGKGVKSRIVNNNIKVEEIAKNDTIVKPKVKKEQPKEKNN